MKWAEENRPPLYAQRPMGCTDCPPSDKEKGWLYRCYLAPNELPDFVDQLKGSKDTGEGNDDLFDGSISLLDHEGDRDDDPSYTPQEGDRRKVVERQIRERQGQPQFREDLLSRYGERCMVTGCDVLDVLEAAHIKPYRGEDDNHPDNGLLLRSDIHTLFDLDLLAIEPKRLQIELHPKLMKNNEYRKLAGKRLRCAHDRRPSQEALRIRYNEFQKGR